MFDNLGLFYSIQASKCCIIFICLRVFWPLRFTRPRHELHVVCGCLHVSENLSTKFLLPHYSVRQAQTRTSLSGDRVSLKAIPVTKYSVVTISHKINTMTSYEPEVRKDGSLPPSQSWEDNGYKYGTATH